AATRARLRALGADTARITVDTPLPVRAGDHGVLRDPGQHRVAGIEVLDPAPPALRSRGGAAARARELASGEITGARLRRRHFIAESELRALGLAEPSTVIAGWAVDEQRWAELPGVAAKEFAAWSQDNPLAAGMPARTLCARLGL